VDRTIERMRELLPSRTSGQPTVLQVMGPREVSIRVSPRGRSSTSPSSRRARCRGRSTTPTPAGR
jgi:hypothetical protein